MELLSLFCGCGGMDRGFEKAGFRPALAYDRREAGLQSWRNNRKFGKAINRDLSKITLKQIDSDYGSAFAPVGVIGGPPCQGFSIANRYGSADDPRNKLVAKFFNIAMQLHRRSPLSFIVMENVPAIQGIRGGGILEKQKAKLQREGFRVYKNVLDAQDFGVAQRRQRFFLVAINKSLKNATAWRFPGASTRAKTVRTVRDVIAKLPEPVYFDRSLTPATIPFHPNHWCMNPKSRKFSSKEFREKDFARRNFSFRMLLWDKPSYTASYGNREVHVHPNGHRRLSVFEAMRIQGFDRNYKLIGTMSEQITQVSEAVPPPLAEKVAKQVYKLIAGTL